MSVRLEGGFEAIDFWHEVREEVVTRLKHESLLSWEVTLTPMTASARETADVTDYINWAISACVAKQKIEIAMPFEQAENDEAAHTADSILEVIDQLIEAGEDDDNDD